MTYDNDLKFLQDTFKKTHVKVTLINPDDLAAYLASHSVESALGGSVTDAAYGRLIASPTENAVMYRVTDSFGLRYVYFLLPDRRDAKMLVMGPYLSEPMSESALLQIGELIGAEPSRQKHVEEYFSAIPVLGDGNLAFSLLDTFCEHVFRTLSFPIVDIKSNESELKTAISKSTMSDNFDSLMLDIRTMEQRYAFENELIDAVVLGQEHKINLLSASFSVEAFEKRLTDRLRNAKNYAIIMNTLLRKAAERGGVHPIHIDRVSGEIAKKIEEMTALSSSKELMFDIFRTYCRLVRQHSTGGYSPVVQKTILIIDSDLSADLTLSALADAQNVSHGYLSAVFKRETGKTLSEYVRERRIHHAAHMLRSTKLQVQTIALHCGIVDVQYFSKIFKRMIGKTPKEYRES